jgi:hypothetical protein
LYYIYFVDLIAEIFIKLFQQHFSQTQTTASMYRETQLAIKAGFFLCPDSDLFLGFLGLGFGSRQELGFLQ